MTSLVLAGAPTGCWTNLGDEAILAGMVDALRTEMPDVSLTVLRSSPPETYEPYECASVAITDLEATDCAIAEADALLLGGGSIFFDYWGCDASTILTKKQSGAGIWAGLALLAASHDVPIMTYDIGLTPLRTEDGLLATRATLELAEAVTVRDGVSADLATSWGLDRSKIRITGDPAISVELNRENPPDPGDTTPADGPVLAVALRQWETGITDQDAWNRSLAEAIDRHLTQTGGSAVFVPCHRARPWPLTDDEAAAHAVIDHMAHPERASIIPVDLPWHIRARQLTTADTVLAMRYHGALFALRAGVPTVGLSYDSKVAGLFAEFDASGRCLELPQAMHKPDRITALLDDPHAGVGHQRLEAPEDAASTIRNGVAHMAAAEQAAAMIARHLAEDSPWSLLEAGEYGDTADDRDRASAVKQGPAHLTTPPTWQPPTNEAVRRLTQRLDVDSADRPEAIRSALNRIATKVGANHLRPQVAILTNRLVSRAQGKPQIGGAERYALSTARLLRDMGMDVTFYQGGGDFDVADFYGFEVYPIPFGDTYSEFQTGVADEFYRRTLDVDHVLYLMPNYSSSTMRDDAVMVSHGVWWDHELWPDKHLRSAEWHTLMADIYSKPARVISVDANTGNVLRAMIPRAAEKIRHIPSAVDTDAFSPPKAPGSGTDTKSPLAAIGRTETDEPVVLFPRRAEEIRGSELVEPIMQHVPDPCRFVWVGGGSRKAALTEISQRDDRLTVRTASFDKMPKEYAAADVCVIPTIASEGQSLAALEAMASGCAVVVTNIGGLGELVTDGVDGLVCEPIADSLAAAIRRLVRDPGLRARLGAAARQTALRHDETIWRQRWADQLLELGWINHTQASAAVPYDVVKFAIIDFEQRYQRPQQTAAAWGKRGRRVFYIQRTKHQQPDGAPYRITPIADNVYAVTLSLPKKFKLDKRPADAATVTAAMRSLEALRTAWSIETAVAYTEFGPWQGVAAAVRKRWGWPVHYDCMDNWSTFPDVAELGGILTAERKLVRHANSMTVSGRAIQRHWEAARPDTVLARNAADFPRFQQAAIRSREGDIPDTIANINGPIAGFIGDVTWWFDTKIVRHIATSRPDVQFVFVGNVKKHVDLAELRALENVHFLGLQPYSDMPRYVGRFDVCLVPFSVDDATASMDLVKVYEYFAAGKPIVTTPVAEMVKYRQHLYIASGPDEFLSQLNAALREDNPDAVARRQQLARINSWDDRIDTIEQAILPTLAHRTETAQVTAAPAGENQHLLAQRTRQLRTSQAELKKINNSRAMRIVRRYWTTREHADAAIRRTRDVAGGIYRRMRRTNEGS